MSSDVVDLARGWLGTPYRHRASLRGAGCDCLGLLRGLWRDLFGAEPEALPPYRASIRDPDNADALHRAARRHLVAVCKAAPGDVLLFRLNRATDPKHCGILMPGERFIHAQEGLGVVEIDLSPAWRKRVSGTYRFPQVSEASWPL